MPSLCQNSGRKPAAHPLDTDEEDCKGCRRWELDEVLRLRLFKRTTTLVRPLFLSPCQAQEYTAPQASPFRGLNTYQMQSTVSIVSTRINLQRVLTRGLHEMLMATIDRRSQALRKGLRLLWLQKTMTLTIVSKRTSTSCQGALYRPLVLGVRRLYTAPD